MAEVEIWIDGKKIRAQKGRKVLEVALEAGIYIPHLCYHPALPSIGVCRLCVVEIEGLEGLHTSCTTPVEEGMVIRTGSEVIQRTRRLSIELLLSAHPPDCGSCNKYLNCELQSLKQYLLGDELRVRRRTRLFPVIRENPLFDIDRNKCVVCGRCVRACHDLRGVGVLFYRRKGEETYIGTIDDVPLSEAGCMFCGACAEVCPTGAIMDKEETKSEKGKKASLVPCKYECPLEIDVPSFLRYARNRDYVSAGAFIAGNIPFGQVLAHVCDRPCERFCRRGAVNGPVSIRSVKRFVLRDRDPLSRGKLKIGPQTGKRISIVGAGPAGLSAAYYLRLKGHDVTVFESMPLPGGMLQYGIPSYRLPRRIVAEEIECIVKLGVRIETGKRIEDIGALFNGGFDAVLIAVGAQRPKVLSIEGATNARVVAGIEFLREVNSGNGMQVGNEVVVVGGGNVAVDCARVARRLGSSRVHLVSVEPEEALPAFQEEVEEAREEGVLFHPSMVPTRILTEGNSVKGVEVATVRSFAFDEEGNLDLEISPDSEQIVPCDMVILAVGQCGAVPSGFELELDGKGLVIVDPYTFETNREGVFAAGDVVSGTQSVAKAIASARRAASAIDRFLGGDGEIRVGQVRFEAPEPWIGRIEGFSRMHRAPEKRRSAEERIKGFCLTLLEFTEEEALYEARRCLQCDLRLRIPVVKFWGGYL